MADIQPEMITSRTEEPWTPAVFGWTPTLVRTAEVMADTGNLSLAADLCEMLMKDDRIGGVLETRTSALLGLPVSFDGRSKRAIKGLDPKEDWWAIAPETTIRKLHAWGLMLGLALAEKVYVMRDGRDVPTLVVKHPKYLRRDMVTGRWMLRVATKNRTGWEEIEIRPNEPGSRWVMFCPGGDYDRPWVDGKFYGLSKYSALKLQAIMFWGWASERWGLGILQIIPAMGEKTPKIDVKDGAMYVKALRGAGPNAAFIPPYGHEVKVTESVSRNWESFQKQIEEADNAFAVALLGNNLTTQATSGTGKSSDTHAGVSLGRTRFDNEVFGTFFHDHVLVDYAIVNHDNPLAAPWPVWGIETIAASAAETARLQLVAQAGFQLVPLFINRLLSRNEVRMMINPALGTAPKELDEPLPGVAPPDSPAAPAKPADQTPPAA